MVTLKGPTSSSVQRSKQALKRWSLVQRLNVMVSGIVMFALLIFMAMSALWVSNSERNQLALRITTLAQQIGNQLDIQHMQASQIQRILHSLAANEDVLHAQIYVSVPDRPTLRYLMGYQQSGRSPLPIQEFQINQISEPVFTRDYIQVIVPIYAEQTIAGIVMLQAANNAVKLQLQRHVSFSISIFFIVMLSVSLGLRFFTRHLETSIHRFTHDISKASQTRDQLLDSTPYLPSEFSELRYQVRRLLEKFWQEQRYAEHALQQSRRVSEDLESELSDRTQTLLKLNRDLTLAIEKTNQAKRQQLNDHIYFNTAPHLQDDDQD